MNREIKFRAWDKNQELMCGIHNLAFHEFYGYKVVTTKEATDGGDTHNVFTSIDEFELMQYTGLKDKNDKEVYEGDIVKCTKGCPHEVTWLEEYGGVYVGGMPAWYLKGLFEGYAWTGSEEVIGNIYENPELLKGATDAETKKP